MRRIIIISIMAALSARAQTATGTGGATVTGGGTTATVQGNGQVNPRQNTQPNLQQGNVQQNTPRGVNSGNYPPGRPFQTFSNPISPVETNGVQYGQTNQYSQFGTNATAFGMAPTNRYGNYNTYGTNSTTYNASMTNTLFTMSPQQAQNVVQVQTGLNALQQVAVNLGGAQNINQNVRQNPQIQGQLQQVETQISNLAQGQVKPSDDTVQRLTTDLLRADVHARLTADQQLVLATSINQMANSETMTVLQIETAINAAEANLEGAGVPRWISYSVGADLRAMALELQPNLQLQ